MASDAAGPPPTTTAEIPELADFEHQKENIMPLKQGRKASVLSELYTSFHDDHARLQFLASQRKAFEDELANIDDLDDPLDVFNKYIQWIQQHYPEGQNAESDLLHVIERAITVFKKDSRYKNDPRYLKLWIMYARHSTEPIQIFKFLSVNEIGQELGIYYEEYAALMEKLGKFQEAEEIYKLGIHRRAQPFERLSRKYREFHIRMAHPVDLDSAGSQDDNTGTLDSATFPRRAPLTSTAATSRPRQQSSTAASIASSSSRPQVKLAVFRDDDPSARSSAVPTRAATNSWEDFGTIASRRKENVREAESWKGSTLPQTSKPPRVAVPIKVEVFRDESAETTSTSSSSSSSVSSSSSSSSKPVNVLREREIPKPTSTSVLSTAEPSRTTSSSSSSQAKKSDKPKTEVVKFKLELLYVNKREFSFEEVRARSMGYHGRYPSDDESEEPPKISKPLAKLTIPRDSDLQPASQPEQESKPKVRKPLGVKSVEEPKPEKPSTDLPPAPTIPTTTTIPTEESRPPLGALKPKSKSLSEVPATKSMLPVPAKLAVKPDSTSTDTQETTSSNDTQQPKPVKIPSLKPTKRSFPSPTINTKAALADVYDWFNQPLTAEQEEEDYEDEDDTMPASYMANQGIGKLGIFRDVIANPVDAENNPFVIGDQGGKKQASQKLPSLMDKMASLRGDDDEDDENAPTGDHETPVQRKVLGVKSSSLKIFSDENDVERKPSMSTKIPIFHDENAPVTQAPMKKLQIFSDENDVASAKPLATKPIERKALGLKPATVAEESTTSAATLPFNTPFPNNNIASAQPAASETDEDEGSIDVGVGVGVAPGMETFLPAAFHQTRHAPLSTQFIPMTPIAEEATEQTIDHARFDKTLGGYSTISNVNVTLDTILLEPPSQLLNTSVFAATPAVVASAAEEQENLGSILGKGNELLGELDLENVATPFELVIPRIEIATHCDPWEPTLQNTILDQIRPPLSSLSDYVDMSEYEGGHFRTLAKVGRQKEMSKGYYSSRNGLSSSSSSTNETLVKIRQDLVFTFVKKLGEGGFGSVYLVRERKNKKSRPSRRLSGIDSFDFSEDEDPFQTDASISAASSRQQGEFRALKIQQPASSWEYYILKQLEVRLPRALQSSVVQSLGHYVFLDESHLLLDFGAKGTLLDSVNAFSKDTLYGPSSMAGGSSGGMDELLVAFYTIEILKLVEAVHTTGIIHGDVKADNFLVRLEENDALSAVYEPSGANGWDSKGIQLVDWGKSIDLRCFKNGDKIKFLLPKSTTAQVPARPSGLEGSDTSDDASFESWEIRNEHPFTFEVDWYGVAGVIHVLLFGKYMKVVEEEFDAENPPFWNLMSGTVDDLQRQMEEQCSVNGGARQRPHVRLTTPLKRYWQVKLWSRLFDVLLNSGSVRQPARNTSTSPDLASAALDASFPAVTFIRSLRCEMEEFLVENSSKAGKSLRSLLRRQEVLVGSLHSEIVGTRR